MVKNIRIRQIYTDTLSCEPMIERMPNGELLCLCQCGDIDEPAPGNRVYAFHSLDNGDTWSAKESVWPEDGQAVYCTELSVEGNTVTAYLTVHSGHFLDWKCFMVKSDDNGYTWINAGTPPFFPEYTFIRGTTKVKDGRTLIPYQHYPVTKAEHDRVLRERGKDGYGAHTNTAYCEAGLLESKNGKDSWTKHVACRVDMANKDWIWLEPSIAELSDGTIAMLMRQDGTGFLHRCDSKDGGHTWADYYTTDIPNPSCKARLVKLNDGRIALINVPNSGHSRFPLEMWISNDGMNTWSEKIRLTDFPGEYHYPDVCLEGDHLHMVIEHNRHTILYFDITL